MKILNWLVELNRRTDISGMILDKVLLNEESDEEYEDEYEDEYDEEPETSSFGVVSIIMCAMAIPLFWAISVVASAFG